MPDAPHRVFLVDDHELFLSGVRAELGADVEVVGCRLGRRRRDRADPGAATRMSFSWTSTCPGVAARA